MGNPLEKPLDAAKSLLLEALSIESEADRKALLDARCAGNPGLRTEVEALLKVSEGLGDFLDRPVAELPASPEDKGVENNPFPTIDRPSTSEGPGAVIGTYKL